MNNPIKEPFVVDLGVVPGDANLIVSGWTRYNTESDIVIPYPHVTLEVENAAQNGWVQTGIHLNRMPGETLRTVVVPLSAALAHFARHFAR
jgi:hypothetical protein